MTYPVKWFISSMAGAPRCSGTAGDIIALLDACLINGFNVNSVGSLVVLDGVATVTFSVQHGYLQHQIISVENATPIELSGEKRVLTVPDTYTLTFDATGIENITATGAISCRTAAIGGWEKAFTDVNKVAYRSTDITGTRMFYRVDDTTTTYAAIRGYESMGGMDTDLLGDFPTVAQHSYAFQKSSTADTTARVWALCGDDKGIYFSPHGSATYPDVAYQTFFGDIISLSAADNYHGVISGANTATNVFHFSVISASTSAYITRSYTQTDAAIACQKRGFNNGQISIGRGGYAYPNPVNSGILLHYPIIVLEGSTIPRGFMPGLYQPLQDRPLTYNTVITVGNKLFLLCSGNDNNSPFNARTAFDISDGGWR
jgi:hypothetical protein